MIRDPSDGSVKPVMAKNAATENRPTSAENWGLKSLDKPERKPTPAPTGEQLTEHYKIYDVGWKPKEKPE